MADRSVSYTFRGNFTSLQAGLTAAGRSVGDLGTKLTALDKNGAQARAGLTNSATLPARSDLSPQSVSA